MVNNNDNNRIDPERTGYEKPNPVYFRTQQEVKNMYCPRDGHYCEQPGCENCMFEEELR